jgi:hypothetical protein
MNIKKINFFFFNICNYLYIKILKKFFFTIKKNRNYNEAVIYNIFYYFLINFILNKYFILNEK